jgi:dihydrofolate reductase
VTYEEFAGYWPQQSAEEMDIAAYMNETPKYVVSSTLDRADWQNTTLIDGKNAVAELQKLKEQPGKKISITGSGTLVRSLLREGLLDELHLLVHPIVVASGKKRLFPEGYDQQPLKLVDSRTFDTGVLYLTYQPATG